MADTKFEVILGIFFFKISNVDVLFGKEILIWKFNTINKALPTTKQVQNVDLKNFFLAALNIDSKMFKVHVAIWERKKMLMYSKKQAQVGVLLFDKAFTKISAEYSDYSNVFSAEKTAKLPENIGMNEHAIKLEKNRQPPFGSIYSLGLVELKTLKTYI